MRGDVSVCVSRLLISESPSALWGVDPWDLSVMLCLIRQPQRCQIPSDGPRRLSLISKPIIMKLWPWTCPRFHDSLNDRSARPRHRAAPSTPRLAIAKLTMRCYVWR
jgi:hypothetical protein